MTPADKDAMLSAYVRRGDSLLTGDVFTYGFVAGLSHAREQAAARLAERADGLTGEHAWFAAAELREQAEKIRSGK
jgi:hypothetical protein